MSLSISIYLVCWFTYQGFQMKKTFYKSSMFLMTYWQRPRSMSVKLLVAASAKFRRIFLRSSSFVLWSACVIKNTVALSSFSLILSNALKVLMNRKMVLLKVAAVPQRSAFLKARMNLSLGVLEKVRQWKQPLAKIRLNPKPSPQPGWSSNFTDYSLPLYALYLASKMLGIQVSESLLLPIMAVLYRCAVDLQKRLPLSDSALRGELARMWQEEVLPTLVNPSTAMASSMSLKRVMSPAQMVLKNFYVFSWQFIVLDIVILNNGNLGLRDVNNLAANIQKIGFEVAFSQVDDVQISITRQYRFIMLYIYDRFRFQSQIDRFHASFSQSTANSFPAFYSLIDSILDKRSLTDAPLIQLIQPTDKSYSYYFLKKSMSTAPKITFGANAGASNYITSPQLSVAAPQGPIASYINPNPAYVYNNNQIISGQPPAVTVPPANYEYSGYKPAISSWRNTNAGGSIEPALPQPPAQPRVSDEIERPRYTGTSQIVQPTKKLGPDSDPPKEAALCHPCWWIIGGLIALALLALALLFGLGVIGGSGNSGAASGNAASVSSNVPVSPTGPNTTASAGTSTPSTSGNTTGTSGSTTSVSTAGKVGSGSTPSESTSGSTATTSGSTPTGTTSAGATNGSSATGSTSGTTSGTNTASPTGTTSGTTAGSTTTPSGSTSTSPSGSTSTTPSGSTSSTPSGSTSTTPSGSTSSSTGTVSGVTGVSPIPYTPITTTPSTTTTQPTTTQPSATTRPIVKPAAINPVAVQPVSVQPIPVSSTK